MRIESYGPFRIGRRPFFQRLHLPPPRILGRKRLRCLRRKQDFGSFLAFPPRALPVNDERVGSRCARPIHPARCQSDAIDELGFKEIAPGHCVEAGVVASALVMRRRGLHWAGSRSPPSVASASAGRSKEQASSRARFVGRCRGSVPRGKGKDAAAGLAIYYYLARHICLARLS
jgi:hypothetical protein